MSTIALNCAVFDAISQRTTLLSCFNLNNCHYKTQYLAMTKKLSEEEIRNLLAKVKRNIGGKQICTGSCGYKEDLFYCNEEDMLRRPHDTEETRIEGFSPEKLRNVSDQHLGKAVIYMRQHWAELSPIFAEHATLVFRKGMDRAADSHDYAIEQLMQQPDELAMLDELADGTAVYIFMATKTSGREAGSYAQVFLMHKTPTMCALVRCHSDGACINSSFFTRVSPTEPWEDQDNRDDAPANPEEFHQMCAEFYGLFYSMQLMEDDFATFSHTIAPGAFMKYGLDKYINYAKFPLRVFSGY